MLYTNSDLHNSICKELATSDDFYVLQINFDGWGCVSKNRPFKCVGLKKPKNVNLTTTNPSSYLSLPACVIALFLQF